MNDLVKTKCFKLISFVLIHAFLMLDFAWAGLIQETDCLSPNLNISNPFFVDSFDYLFKKEINGSIENSLFEGTFTQLELTEKLGKIFKQMGIDVNKKDDIFTDIKTAFEQGQDITQLTQQKEAEFKKMAGWIKKNKKELVRDKELLVFLENNKLPILRRAADAEIRELAIEYMIKKMAALKEILDSGSQQEVLELIADTLDIIEDVIYPAYNFSTGFFVINRENLKHWIKKVFFWANHDKYNPHASADLFWNVIRGYVEHAKAYVSQRNLDKELEKVRENKREELGEFRKEYVLDHILVKRTGGALQLNAVTTISALAMVFADRINTFISIYPHSTLTIGFAAGMTALGYLFYRFLKSEKFGRIISPLYTIWYVWRLGLKGKNPADNIIIEMVRQASSRKQLIQKVRNTIAYLQDEMRKQQRTAVEQEVDKLLEGRLKEILFSRLERMGTDAYYWKALYRFYSRHFRARKFKIELNLNPIGHAYDRELLNLVKNGWKNEELIHNYLELNLRSALETRRKYSRKILEKFVQKGMLERSEFIQMSMNVLKNGSAEAAKDIILGLEACVDGFDKHLRTKVLIHLKVNLEKHKKRIKQIEAKAKKNNGYFIEELNIKQAEEKRIEALLNSIAEIVLEDMAIQTDIYKKSSVALTLESVINDMDKDLLGEFKGQLINIRGKYEQEIEALTQRFKRESMAVYIINVMKGINANNAGAEKNKTNKALLDALKTNKREIERVISAVEKNLNKNNLGQNQNNNIFSIFKGVERIAPRIKYLSPFNARMSNFVGQAI